MVTLTRTTAAQRSMLGNVANAGEMHARMLLDLEASVAALEGGEAAEVSKAMLASVAGGASGASLVGLEDADDYFEATTVETALAEVMDRAVTADFKATNAAERAARSPYATEFFHVVMNMTSAQLATGVTLVAAGNGTLHLDGFKILVDGAVAYDGTFTKATIQDTADVPVVLVEATKAALGANALLLESSANVTPKAAYVTGATADKDLKIVADGTVTAGSDLRVTVWGRRTLPEL